MSMQMFLILSILSYLLCFNVNSWFFMWVLLEVNTLSMSSLMNLYKNSGETILKYFLVQSSMSTLMIFCMVVSFNMGNSTLINSLVMVSSLSLAMKMGSVPFHSWFVHVIFRSKWNMIFIFSSWQKILPVYLLTFMNKNISFMLIMMNALVGAISQMGTNKMKYILAFSSIYNLSWMILITFTNLSVLFKFCFFYWISLAYSIFFIKKLNMSFMNTKLSSALESLVFMSVLGTLSGIPPFISFLAKFLVIEDIISKGLIFITLFTIVMMSVNVFVFTRMLSNQMLLKKKQKEGNIVKKHMFTIFLVLNLMTLFLYTI